ncbi:unnamed protein product [Rotaria sp. Silwood1]|nr:unnamed protein product [Rotaria sp. Silwood1]CAF1620447.1 unnamed protein product [Rotaria sp. Silwood1]CAF3741844.1 unnamed protein product [Rotaria sp. Silwood1]CAF3770678.1 unnamed protein product [Rotaria sp. Silwood1]CAF4899507.1 unnamed protein product [Rotaria sp. Silwood1]
MHIVFRFILILIVLRSVIHCQDSYGGSRGGGGSHSGFRGDSYGSHHSHGCRGYHCGEGSGIIVVIVVGGIFALIAVIFVIVLCYHRYKRKSFQSNSAFVNQASAKSRMYDKDHFEAGVWSCRYYQYNKWHGPYHLSLSFDHLTSKVSGQGIDDVGIFTIDGVFSSQTHRMDLIKTYERDTGNSNENIEHQVTLQLTWNSDHNQFEGKWFVRTSNYRGEGKFELKLDEFSELLIDRLND